MFDLHQARISEYARRSPANLARVALFVIVSVRTPFYRVAAEMAEVDQHGLDAPSLWGWKRKAYAAWLENAEAHHSELERLWRASDNFDSEALAYVAGLPGFGPVKAGFVLQLAYGRVGCLDVHNLRALGLSDLPFKATKAKAKSEAVRFRAISAYTAACEAAGGCRALWDQWCDHMAGLYPQHFDSGNAVSREHVLAIGA